MFTNEHDLYFEQLQLQLVPNLHNLDPQVQQDILKVLQIIVRSDCTRDMYCTISKMSLLEETPVLRAHVWKVLLGTMGVGWGTWADTRAKNEELYTALKERFCPKEINDLFEQSSQQHEKQAEEQQQGVHFDRQLWNEISLDTKRTHSTINFFQSESPNTKIYRHRPTKHSDILNRILYIWSSVNSAVRYVQGMNEILAPLYYLEFQCLTLIHWDRESQVFSMFSSLMSSIIDMHIKQMDDCETGIMGRMIYLNRFLRVVDGGLWAKMEKQGIYAECYSFRWLALLLAQEFGIYDTIRLWDHVLACNEDMRFFYVYCLCIGILQLRRPIIMEHDFNISLPMIQKLRDIDVDELIELGNQIFGKYRGVKINEEFQKLVIKDGKDKQALALLVGKAEEIHLNRGSWSYGDILRHAGNYLAKLGEFGKEK